MVDAVEAATVVCRVDNVVAMVVVVVEVLDGVGAVELVAVGAALVVDRGVDAVVVVVVLVVVDGVVVVAAVVVLAGVVLELVGVVVVVGLEASISARQVKQQSPQISG